MNYSLADINCKYILASEIHMGEPDSKNGLPNINLDRIGGFGTTVQDRKIVFKPGSRVLSHARSEDLPPTGAPVSTPSLVLPLAGTQALRKRDPPEQFPELSRSLSPGVNISDGSEICISSEIGERERACAPEKVPAPLSTYHRARWTAETIRARLARSRMF